MSTFFNTQKMFSTGLWCSCVCLTTVISRTVYILLDLSHKPIIDPNNQGFPQGDPPVGPAPPRTFRVQVRNMGNKEGVCRTIAARMLRIPDGDAGFSVIRPKAKPTPSFPNA